VQGSRFRHGTKFIRWREDKDPESCTWGELRPPKSKETVEALFR
jgi:ATP-dependent DNA ligase